MSTATYSTLYTRTHTATYLTDVVLGSIGDILAHLGLGLTRHYATFATNETAINQWIHEESLDSVVLECTAPNGTIVLVAEFPLDYTGGGQQQAEFVNSRAALARYRAKLAAVPAGTTYRLVCTFRSAHTSMPGWSTTSRASTAGVSGYTFGTLAGAPHASASARFYLRT
ncbi:MAG: Bacterial domain 2 [Actinoplanes sp.]|nr:Bacterial domain 2 [Actinoplanes sp.]MDT5032587.1 Bacterial domain 2 [Actinoplanes sp.]